jgi:Tfp pilus assembly protein PilP
MKFAEVAPAVVALLVGLGAGVFGGKLLPGVRGDDERVGKLEARVGDLETRMRRRFESLEAQVDKIGKETVTAARRAAEGVRPLSEAGRTTPDVAATRPARPEPPKGQTVPDGLATLRMSGVIQHEGQRVALIEDAQDQGHVVRVGDTIANARVVEITDDTVMIQKKSGEASTITGTRR